MNEPQKLPGGWDETRIQDLISHYDAQNEDEQAAEIQESLEAKGITMMAVPSELADEVRAVIARKGNTVQVGPT
jgi:hypothetical protein